MLISIYIQEKHYIYIIFFMIVNIISDYILKKIENDRILYIISYYICEICLIFFYIVEKYIYQQIKMKNVLKTIKY